MIRNTLGWIPSITLFILLLSGCAPKDVGIVPTDTAKQKQEIKEEQKKDTNALLLDSMSPYIGKRDGGDCSGFVSLINQKNGNIFFDPVELNGFYDNSRKSKALYNLYKAKGKLNTTQTPKVGDLVFFALSNTTQSTKQKTSKKPKTKSKVAQSPKKEETPNITHVGIVYAVEKDGTAKFLHHSNGKNVFDYINIVRPDIQAQEGREVNSYFRRCGGGGAKKECLAPAFFKGFGSVG